jgi:NIMA (never in mitosis gene a)-related kinase
MVDLNKIQESAVLDEIKYLYNLDHPHIVKFEEYWIDSYIIYIVMEYVDGGNLSELMI